MNYKLSKKEPKIPSLKVLPYKANIGNELPDKFVFIGRSKSIIADADVDDLTCDHMEEFMNATTEKDEDTLYERAIIGKALGTLPMPMHIINPEARVTQYCAKCLYRLNGVGYGKFRAENPKQTLTIVMRNELPLLSKVNCRNDQT